ncbi:hypothetical protein EDB84DRAFT_1441693 [Lactarius hengduanensis]|nr:hypothetical protein EDB84DRAFT_1441693 [Lactarius hengduanensis]
MQLATLHSFTSDYAKRHRPDLPPEASACPCGYPDRSFVHLIYECPRYERARGRYITWLSVQYTVPTDLFTGGELYDPYDFLVFLQKTGAASRPEMGPLVAPFDPG